MFGEAKEWHGMSRFRLRRLWRVNVEALLIAAGQNIKRLLACSGRRPSNLVQAAALLPPPPAPSTNSRLLPRSHRRRSTPPFACFSTGWGILRSPDARSCIIALESHEDGFWGLSRGVRGVYCCGAA